MARFKNLILTELGNTTDGYGFNVDPVSKRKVTFTFKSEQNSYKVDVNKLASKLSVDYYYKTENGKYAIGLTGEKNQFRVIATVVNAVKHAWENKEEYFANPEEITTVGFIGTTKDGESFGDGGTARSKLYMQFINRQFPDAEVQRGGGAVKVYPES